MFSLLLNRIRKSENNWLAVMNAHALHDVDKDSQVSLHYDVVRSEPKRTRPYFEDRRVRHEGLF